MRTIPRTRPQLLVDPDRMIGRREELGELRRLLTGAARLVCMTGPGGGGKTTLARAAAVDLARSFKDAVWFVDVTEVSDPALLPATVGREVGAQVVTGHWRSADLAAAVGRRRGVLVLDGCDGLLDGCAGLVDELLRRCPDLRVLATGRQPLRVTGETVLVLPPLSFPASVDEVRTAEQATTYDAVQLFVAKAATVVPSFRLTDENAADVAAVCAEVEGLPLAVELAAARVAVLSPGDILTRLRDPYRLLTKRAKDAPARQRSLRASVEASHAMCSAEEQMLWARLSVLAGGFDLETAESVCSGDGIDELDVLDLVDTLLEKSVLTREEIDGGRVRYRMLESLRTFGAEQLGADAERWRLRHERHWCELSARFAETWFGPGQETWCARLDADRAGLDDVLEHALAADRPAVVAEVTARLEPWWVARGTVTEARHWLDRALDPARGQCTDIPAMATAAWFAVLQMDTVAAKDMVQRAADRLHTADLPPELLMAEGGVAIFHGDHARAVELLGRAVHAASERADLQLESSGWLLLGLAHGLAGDGRAAMEADQRALDMCTAAGDLHLRSYAAGLLGLTLLDRGDPESADQHLRDALRMKARLGDRFSSAFLLEALAWAAAASERVARAATLLTAAEEAWAALGISLDGVPYLEERRRAGESAVRGAVSAREQRAATEQGRALSWPEAVAYAVDDVLAQRADDAHEDPAAGVLTPREREVADLIGQGMSNRAIAEALVVSQRTAQGHVENILRKLGFTSRTQVAAWVAGRGD